MGRAQLSSRLRVTRSTRAGPAGESPFRASPCACSLLLMKQRTILMVMALVAVLFAGQAVAQIVRPDPLPIARSYLCFEAKTAAEVTRKANEAGAQGWKMVSSGVGQGSGIWCFEQFAVSRPVK